MIARLLIAIFGLLAAGLAPCALAQEEPIVIRFSHVAPRDTPKGKGAERFRELAEKATAGRVRVEVHADGSLYKDREELEALQLGAVQMLAPALTKFGQLGLREFEVFDLPYLFPSRQAWQRITQGPIGRDLLLRLEGKGIAGLAYWEEGFKLMSANRPLRRPDDFAGLRMGILSSRVLDAQMRALGAQPQAVALGELGQGLREGMLDGTEGPAASLYASKLHDIQKHMTLSEHGFLGHAVIVNQKFWSQLPSDVRRKLESALREASRYVSQIAEQDNAQALQALRDSGRTRIHLLSEQESAAWRQALLPVWKEMEERIGADLIEAVHREMSRPRGRGS